MAGDFPHLTLYIMSQWPHRDNNPITRGWLPPFAITLMTISTLVVGARIWSSRRGAALNSLTSSRGFGLDDALASFAWLFALLFTIACVTGTLGYGFNRHIWDVHQSRYNGAAMIQWLSELAFLCSTCLTKLSALCFYRRLDPPCPKGLRRIIYFFLILTVSLTAAFILAQILICHPTATYWAIPSPSTMTRVQRNCASQQAIYPLQGATSTISTLYSIMIPVLVLRNIPMARNQRIGLRLISLLGLVVLGAGIARTVFLTRLAQSPTGDATWNGFNVFVWSQVECQLSLVCASIPFFQRFISQYPTRPVVSIYPESKSRNDSVISRVGSSLSGKIMQSMPFRRSNSPRQMEISRPQVVEIPAWEFETLESPHTRALHVPADLDRYERYLAGMHGPVPPPKDSRVLFDPYLYRGSNGSSIV